MFYTERCAVMVARQYDHLDIQQVHVSSYCLKLFQYCSAALKDSFKVSVNVCVCVCVLFRAAWRPFP